MSDLQANGGQSSNPRYAWPWVVGSAVLLAIVLAVLWMSHEVSRTRRIRDANLPDPPAVTNSGVNAQ